MELFNRKNLLIRRSHQTAVCTFINTEREESVAEVFIQNRNGIHYLQYPFSGTLPDSATLYYETYRVGLYSPRPYHIQCTSDASVFYSVLALYTSCCKAWNLDATALIKEADCCACISELELREIKDLAKWQNTVFPGAWDTQSITALSQALHDVGCPTLASLIEQRTMRRRGY
jgi:hypothetical protein